MPMQYPGAKTDKPDDTTTRGEAPVPPLPPEGPSHPDISLPPHRGDVVLFLGVLSLLMCGPLGLVAWTLGSRDLRRIRRGELSAKRIGMLRAGRLCGIIGTFLFTAGLVFCVFWVHTHLQGNRLGRYQEWNFPNFFKPKPLAPQHFVFVGEWQGNRGTVIYIKEDGTADFVSKHTTVQGGTVRIEEDSLHIILFGFSSSWRIDTRPHMDERGNWRMKLDGELFVKKGQGDLVLMPGTGRIPA